MQGAHNIGVVATIARVARPNRVIYPLTRPSPEDYSVRSTDISFAVTVLSQYAQNPGKPHWEAVKRVFRYLKTTKNYELTFGLNNNGLHGYTDADHATQQHYHSISGYVFKMFGGAISWSAKKQPVIALSTTEAEYLAATHAAKEAAWIRNFFEEINQLFANPIILFCDNQSAIALTKDGQYHAHTKQISTRYHFIREMVENRVIVLVYCPTTTMVADTLTVATIVRVARPNRVIFR